MALGDEKAFGFKMTHFIQTDASLETAWSGFGHGDVKPFPGQARFIAFHQADDLLADGVGVTQVGADKGTALGGRIDL